MINIPTPNKFDSIVAAKQQEEADIILQQVVNNLENGTTFCLGTHTPNSRKRTSQRRMESTMGPYGIKSLALGQQRV